MIGVYVLLYRKKVVYIGQTKHWPIRMEQHRSIKFDEAKLIECNEDALIYLESRLIRIFKPSMNVKGSKKKRITKEWIIENHAQIGSCKNRKELNDVAAKAKALFGYSPMYSSHDLAWTIIRDYCLIYNMQWDYERQTFCKKESKFKEVA